MAPVCVLIAKYNSVGPFERPDRLPVVMMGVLTKSLRISGFIQREFAYRRPAVLPRDGWMDRF